MLGFIGLGTMGAPMCRNLAAKSGQEVRAFDSDLEVLAQMDEAGVSPAESIRDVAEHADIVFLSLPGGPQVNAVCLGAGSLLTHLKPGGLVVDLSHHAGEPGARPERALPRARHPVRRRAGGAHAPGGGGRHAVGDGGRARAGVRAHQAAARVLRDRHHALRRPGRRPGDEDRQQHGAVPERGGDRRGAGADPPRRRRPGARLRSALQGLGRQLRAAQPRHEGDAEGRLSRSARSPRNTR